MELLLTLELAEIGVVTPYDESHVGMEHESSGEVDNDVMDNHEWAIAASRFNSMMRKQLLTLKALSERETFQLPV